MSIEHCYHCGIETGNADIGEDHHEFENEVYCDDCFVTCIKDIATNRKVEFVDFKNDEIVRLNVIFETIMNYSPSSIGFKDSMKDILEASIGSILVDKNPTGLLDRKKILSFRLADAEKVIYEILLDDFNWADKFAYTYAEKYLGGDPRLKRR
jgi:hypothetical protein